MNIIVLTGGIASGKTLASKHLQQLGAQIIDADIISRQLTAPDGAAITSLRSEFGACFDKNGELNRRRLREKVFADPVQLKRLNDLMHPLIFDAINSELERLAHCDNVVVVVPLYFDTPFRLPQARVLNIACDEATRIKRLVVRDNISMQTAATMVAAQCSEQQRRTLADITISNNVGQDQFLEEVQRVYLELAKKTC